MGKENITRIEDFFNFYWTNNKMTPFRSEMDKRFMLELPHQVTQQIYIEYVFQDFIYKFGHIFRFHNSVNKLVFCQKENTMFRSQIVMLLQEVEPRYYTAGDELIQD